MEQCTQLHTIAHVLHNDIKLDNILVSNHDGERSVRIIDFEAVTDDHVCDLVQHPDPKKKHSALYFGSCCELFAVESELHIYKHRRDFLHVPLPNAEFFTLTAVRQMKRGLGISALLPS